MFEFCGDCGGFGVDRCVVEPALGVDLVDLLVGDVAQGRAVVQDGVEVGLVDVGVAAAVGIAQRGQRIVDGRAGFGPALFGCRCSRPSMSSLTVVVLCSSAVAAAWLAA